MDTVRQPCLYTEGYCMTTIIYREIMYDNHVYILRVTV